MSGLLSIFRPRDLSSFDASGTRERLIQGSRIVVVDDEDVLLIEELRKLGFAVDHDRDGNDLARYDRQIYDVAIIDYHGVGQSLGRGHGLELVKHIRRVSSRTRIIAYTSRSLNASESEFFRLSHAVLPKDLGLGDSLAIIEAELGKALEKSHLFEALIEKLQIGGAEEKEKLQKALVRALKKNNKERFRQSVISVAGKAAEKTVDVIISKLFA